MAEDFAAVRFIEKNEFSEVPNNWLVDIDEGKGWCKWPPVIIKNMNYFLKARYPPKSDWPLYEIEVLRYCDTLEKARKPASDAEYTSSEETQGRGCRTRRPRIFSDSETSDESDVITNGKKTTPVTKMPQIYKSSIKNDCISPSQIAKHQEKTFSDKASTPYDNNFQSTVELNNYDTNMIETEKSPEKLILSSPLYVESYTPTLNDDDRKREEGLNFIRKRQSATNSHLMMSFSDDNTRRLQLLEERTDAMMNLLGKILLGIKDVQQQLALKNSNHVSNDTNKQDSQRIKDALPLETKEAILRNCCQNHSIIENLFLLYNKLEVQMEKILQRGYLQKIFRLFLRRIILGMERFLNIPSKI